MGLTLIILIVLSLSCIAVVLVMVAVSIWLNNTHQNAGHGQEEARDAIEALEHDEDR